MDSFSTSDSQSLIYYIILLVFLLSSFVVGRKLNLKESVKHILIWAGIALFFVGLYVYRYEFMDLKNRIIGEISPMSVRHDQKGRIVINMSKDGHFYVNVRVNNKLVRFLVDTGASDIVLNLQSAKKAGIDLRGLKFDKRYNTANGVVFGASVVLDQVALGDVVFYDVSASVNSADLDISLLGMSFLRQFKRYEFYRDQLILER